MGSGEQGGPRDTPIYSAPQGISSTTLLACGEVKGGGGGGAGTSWAGIFMGNFNQNADRSLYLKKFILTKLGR